VSPTHHVIQLDANSDSRSAPRVHIPQSDKVALMRQQSGESRTKRPRSRALSSATGSPSARRKLVPATPACEGR
jgi:hypothetical protein